jgi:hypothetical protein
MEAAAAMSAAVSELASQFQSNSPKRRERAVLQLQDDADFSDGDEASIALAFTDKTTYADTFLSMKTKEKCTRFAQKLLSL